MITIDNITRIISETESRAKLINLVEQQHALNLAMEVHKQEKVKIAEEYKLMGLSASEFTKFVKYAKDQGNLLNYQRELLEQIDTYSKDQGDLLNYERELLEQIDTLVGFIDTQVLADGEYLFNKLSTPSTPSINRRVYRIREK